MPLQDDRLLELALQTSADPMLILNGQLEIAWANLAATETPEGVQGLALAEFLCSRNPSAQFFQPESSRQLMRKLEALPFGEVRWSHQQSVAGDTSAPSLLLRWHLLAELPERYILLSLHNLARRRSDPGPAEQALRSQQAFMNQLIHELRTPLAIAVGSLRRAVVRAADLIPEPSAEHLGVVRQELKRMQRLIDHLAVLSDLDAGSTRWRLRPVMVSSLLAGWFDELADDVRQSTTVLVHDQADAHYLSVDPAAMAIVLNNLVDNAQRYSEPGSEVLLSIHAEERQLTVYVADWGCGIPKAMRDHVFDRFRRLEEHRDPARADGAGLGLSVCRGLLSLMNARISVLDGGEQGECAAEAPSTVLKICLPHLGPPVQQELPTLHAEMAPVNGAQEQAVDRFLRFLLCTGEQSGDPSRLCQSCSQPC